MSNTADFEQWKGALLIRSDQQFFDLIRASLGELQTPFNKHALVKKLITYLKKPETRTRVLTLITKEDAFLLTAIYVLNDPDLPTLYSFLKAMMPYIDLYNHLLNLEERLLIYRNVEGDGVRIRFNPHFFEDLRSSVLDTDLVFKSDEGSSGPPPWIRDQLLLATLAYVREHPAIFKAGGKLKSKIEEDIRRRFSFADTANSEMRVRLVIKSLEASGIIIERNGQYTVCMPVLTSFGSLSPAGRVARLAGALAAAGDGVRSADVFSSAARLLLDNLNPERIYGASCLSRILLASGLPLNGEEECGRLFDAMVSLGLLSSIERDYALCPASPAAGETDAAIVVQPNFEVTLTASASFRAGIELALGAELRSYDIFPVFELTRDSVTRRFADEVRVSDFVASFERLSGSALPSNILFSLESWEKEFLSVRIFHGSVLLVDPDRRHLVEHNREMGRLITSIPAPGVYLIRTADQELLEKALRDSGIFQRPAVEGAESRGAAFNENPSGTNLQAGAAESEGFPSIRVAATPIRINSKKLAGKGSKAIDVIAELTAKLESMKLKQEINDELSRMIENRLLLYPEQLEFFASTTKGKNEARGFDYVGKVRIIEQALSREDLLLEITTRTAEGQSVKYLIKPMELNKSTTDLILHGTILPEQTDKKLRVRAISQVRSVRGSLYVNS